MVGNGLVSLTSLGGSESSILVGFRVRSSLTDGALALRTRGKFAAALEPLLATTAGLLGLER